MIDSDKMDDDPAVDAPCHDSPCLFAETKMRRTSIMTLGLVLIFFGIQLNLIETYVITPRFSNFVSHHASAAERNIPGGQINANPSPYSPASFASFSGNNNNQASVTPTSSGGPKTITPPRWICWPILFLGTVVFLHGLSLRHD